MQFRHGNMEYFIRIEDSNKKTLFLHHNLLDWCKSGKKEKRTPLTRKGGNNGCGCRRKSHSQGQ